MLYQSYVCYNAPGCINKMRSTDEMSHDTKGHMIIKKGILYGVGVVPGDPELMTLLAVKTIKNCSATTARSLRQQKNSAAVKAVK